MHWIRPLCLLIVLAAPVHANDTNWAVEPVGLSADLVQLLGQSGRVYARTQRGGSGTWMEIVPCPNGPVCLRPGQPRAALPRPAGALPDGRVARARRGSPTTAWYASPSGKYGHGILGDGIEPTELVVITASGGKRLTATAPDGGVYEDLSPRIADLDGDGSNEIVAIASGAGEGASIQVYGVRSGRLVRLAATRPIGRTHRWRNPSTLADLTGNGRPEIAEVVTPHIGGTLRIWSFDGKSLLPVAARRGYSNHVIGSRDLDLSLAADVTGDGRAELILPTADRGSLEILAIEPGRIKPLARIPLPARIDKSLVPLKGSGGPRFIAGLEDGRLAVISRTAASQPVSGSYCIENRHQERLLIVVERSNGAREQKPTGNGESWCLSKAGLRAVWVFTHEDALEGCSRLVGAEAGLILNSYTAFDNCAWSIRK